jgi:ABC-type bacteriocin/lantibiotic exporter with double-glycine peptidase domain
MPSFLLNVPLIAQRDRADCLPACIEMVLAYQGRSVDPGWLRHVLESKSIGTPGFKVLNLAQQGYAVTYSPATDERVLLQALSSGVPPIALVLTANLSYWDRESAHAVVVVGIDDDTVVVNDPAFPASGQRIPRNEFMLAWSDFDYLYALIRPNG